MPTADRTSSSTPTPFTIRSIIPPDLDCVAGNCWENRQTQQRLLALQEILGIAAWRGSDCIGQLHCYRVELPQWDNTNFPGYGRDRPVSWPLGWPLLAAREKGLSFDRPVWGHACFHVGFTLGARHADPACFGQGIGTAMCQASVQWAREHGYAAIIAHGGSKAVPDYNVWMGCLPWTTYARMGFQCVAMEEDGRSLPWWTQQGGASPQVVQQAKAALDAGTPIEDLCARLMVLRL